MGYTQFKVEDFSRLAETFYGYGVNLMEQEMKDDIRLALKAMFERLSTVLFKGKKKSKK